ncbi:MAG TPA: polysaccharide deacetylase family protein [Natronosporangium sp.]
MPTSPPILDAVPGDGNVLGLSFDDGPNPPDTTRLLAVLREHAVKAVFCLVGQQVRRHPELVRQIVDDGHVLGNHSMYHDDMGDWPPDRIRADLQATAAAIEAAVPGTPVPYWRAPFGSWGETPAVAAELGMRSLGWRLAVFDWQPPGTRTLVRRLLAGVSPGAVVLLHDGGGDRSQTVEAVARVIPMLHSAGWRFGLPAS